MSVPPESIEVGKCYLGDNGQVRRVVRIWPDGRVQYETRAGYIGKAKTWKPGMLDEPSFAASAQREVPCDWTPEKGEQHVAYTLSLLAPGSYNVLLNGKVIASLVRSGPSKSATWTAELLDDLPPGKRPAPFTEAEHTFGSFEEARAWLGNPGINPIVGGV